MESPTYQTFDLTTARTLEVLNIPTNYMRVMLAEGTSTLFFSPSAPVGELLLAEKTICTADGSPIGDVYISNDAQADLEVVLMFSNRIRVGF